MPETRSQFIFKVPWSFSWNPQEVTQMLPKEQIPLPHCCLLLTMLRSSRAPHVPCPGQTCARPRFLHLLSPTGVSPALLSADLRHLKGHNFDRHLSPYFPLPSPCTLALCPLHKLLLPWKSPPAGWSVPVGYRLYPAIRYSQSLNPSLGSAGTTAMKGNSMM